jgi:hypothetical protein
VTAILPTNHAGIVTAATLREGIHDPTGRRARIRRDPQPLPNSLPDVVTAKVIARIAGTTVSAVQNWARAGLLPSRKVGGGQGRLEFDGAVALAFLRKRAGGAR